MIELYYAPGSLPCRSVLLVAAKLQLRLDLRIVDLRNKEHLRPEFLRMNPQHCVPLLVDDGFHLWESRAIVCYLANAYDKDQSLYPKEPKARGIVDQRLYFDMGTLTKTFGEYYNPGLHRGETPDPIKFENIRKAFEILNSFLNDTTYVAGPGMTIADITLAATTSNFEALGFDVSPYANVSRWYNRMKKELPQYEEINEYGIKLMKERIELLKNNKW